MGLYLCIFDGDEEVEGVEVGPYSDFNAFRDCIVREIENGNAGSKFPLIVLHSDSDGQWSPVEARQLEIELSSIREKFRRRPPIKILSEWQKQIVKDHALQLECLYDCFIDVDGEPLLDRLIDLARLSYHSNLPIIFQ